MLVFFWLLQRQGPGEPADIAASDGVAEGRLLPEVSVVCFCAFLSCRAAVCKKRTVCECRFFGCHIEFRLFHRGQPAKGA